MREKVRTDPVRTLGVLLLASLLAGCATQVLDPQPVRVAGDPDGTIPTNLYLKTDIQGPNGFVTVAFERKDWYVAGLERELETADWLAVAGKPKIDREVVVEDVESPADLAKRYRFDDMKATKEQRASMDAEWDARLEELRKAKPDVGWLGWPQVQMVP